MRVMHRWRLLREIDPPSPRGTKENKIFNILEGCKLYHLHIAGVAFTGQFIAGLRYLECTFLVEPPSCLRCLGFLRTVIAAAYPSS